MKRGKYLRDARHLDKMVFTLVDRLFYQPFHTYYDPSDEYISVVRALLKETGDAWEGMRDGFWFHVHPKDYAMPSQGWKIHVSATLWNGTTVLRRAATIALASGVAFKFAIDRYVLSMMSSKRWHRGGSGKFITMYPPDVNTFKVLLERLYAELRDEEGPYVLSDKRYKDCKVLYYRYGGMARRTEVDITGEQTLVILSPDGKAIPDIRTPYFAIPTWEFDPFPSAKSDAVELTLNDGRYIVNRALAFSNSGGVYVAEDRTSGREVVIKEARAHTVVDDRGNDAVKRLKKEQQILELLRETGFTPQPLGAFHEWENFFLVEEYLNGVDIREFMLTQTPLLRVNHSSRDSSQFYEIFKTLVSNIAQKLMVMHERGVVFGDLSPNNIKIDPETYDVRLIDFEVAFREGIDQPAYLYTPGFRSTRKNNQDMSDDLYSLGAIMLYVMFPIAAIASLRTDLYEKVLKTVLADIGWSETDLFKIISGLSKNEITCAQVCELLEKPVKIHPTNYSENVHLDWCKSTAQELGNFILASMRPDSDDCLFPSDPFMHETNPLGLGFGACGVLYALKKSGFEIPKSAYDWVHKKLNSVNPERLAPGLLTGAAGIAWTLWELGVEDRAREFMNIANQSTILTRHHSYLYGMAGVGMANLHFYIRTNNSKYLARAIELAESLLSAGKQSDSGLYWEFDDVIHLGYGYGQSGVALFFLRLAELSGSNTYLSAGKSALKYDLSYGVEPEDGVLSFPRGPSDRTLEPYLEDGSAGIARVAMRYGMWDQLDPILADLHRKYAVFPGLLYGLGSFVDVLTDAYISSGDPKFLEMAKRPIAGIRDLYLIRQPQGAATPGDGLFRISCDYATGVAGVLRAFHRFIHHGAADFALDGVAFASNKAQEGTLAGVHSCAISALG